MSGDQVRCSCCGELYERPAVSEGATFWLWGGLDDLPAVLRPRRPSGYSGQRADRERVRHRRAIAKRSKRAARRRV